MESLFQVAKTAGAEECMDTKPFKVNVAVANDCLVCWEKAYGLDLQLVWLESSSWILATECSNVID